MEEEAAALLSLYQYRAQSMATEGKREGYGEVLRRVRRRTTTGWVCSSCLCGGILGYLRS
jgi:hypothetical protein